MRKNYKALVVNYLFDASFRTLSGIFTRPITYMCCGL